jgi:hypothetical protein
MRKRTNVNNKSNVSLQEPDNKIPHTDRKHTKKNHFNHTNKYSTTKTKNTENEDMQEVITTAESIKLL